jgi:hypothetical protein
MTESPEKPFVPDEFSPPTSFDHEAFRLRPLGPEHNASDYAAWTSSVDHIHATPGYEGSSWPRPMTLEENLGDLTRHAGEFVRREAFTYTVLAPDSDTVIGCLYIYPDRRTGTDAAVTSWLRADHAGREGEFRAALATWLHDAWPFGAWTYDGQRHERSPRG